MFYEGDLQSAISEAIKESKLVACFVTDNGEESQLWENDFLQDSSIKETLTTQSVLLRLVAGTKEAGYLTEIFPVPKTPAFIVIKNGQLKEYLSSGVVKAEFQRRILSILFPDNITPQDSSSITPITEAAGYESIQSHASPEASETVEPPIASKSEEKSTDRDDKAKLESKAEASNLQSKFKDQNYAILRKKRQDREERARILKRVEDDKINRRNEAARRKEERERCSRSPSRQTAQVESQRCHSNVSTCETSSLLIRLFDGSTIRTKFPCSATISDEVRNYISQHQPEISDQPYIFKQVLSPLPNRKIEAAEENQSLRDLGCVPSATLILAPISVYTDAYSGGMGATTSNIVGGVLSNGWGLVRGGLGLVTSALGAVVGGNLADNRGESYQQIKNEDHSTTQVASNTKIRTPMSRLEETHRVDEPQFYNGNSVNFQPRPKDHDDDRTKQD